MTKNKGFVSALRSGEKDFAKRNPVTDAKMLVRCLKSNIKFYKGLGWDTRQDEGNLRTAKIRLREVLNAKFSDVDYDSKGNLKKGF